MLVTLAALAHLVPARIDHAPRIDGSLDDAAWVAATPSRDFTEKFPVDGGAPADPTEVRIVYDDRNLYIGFDNPQSVPIVSRLTRRDREVESDRVSIDLDTRGDGRTAYHFEVSAAGVQVDGVRYGDTELALDWDETWDAEVATRADGWSVEMRIPLRELRLAGSASWGMQARRWIVGRGEQDEWSHISRSTGGEVSRYGELGPFDVLSTGASVELYPFALGRLVAEDASLGGAYPDGASIAAGLDVKLCPTPSLSLTGAILPDFAQVEQDEVIVNLTTVETFLPEKRRFFLDGMELFQTPAQVLYTRRIGEVPDSPATIDGVSVTRNAAPAPILGAAKLISTLGSADVGVLSVLTGPVDVPTDGGASARAAPLTAYHALRAQGHHGDLSLGAMGTAAMRYEDTATYPMSGADALCPSGDLVRPRTRCTHDAYVGALDGSWRSGSGDWVAGGQVLGSAIEGGPAIVQPDGTHIEAGDGGAGITARIAREGGSPWLGELDYDGFSRRLDLDDLGYLDRANVHHVFAQLERHDADGFGRFAEASARAEAYGRWNVDGLYLGGGYQLNASATTNSEWQLFSELHWRPGGNDDRELRDGRALERADRLGWELSVESDPRCALAFGIDNALRVHAHGLYAAGGVRVSWQPRTNVELELDPGVLVSTGEVRYLVDAPDGRPELARLHAASWSATVRGTWTPTRRLSIQAFAQALRARYLWRDPLVGTAGARVLRFDELAPGTFDASAYDGGEGAINASVTARWEYRAGSTAYLVYSHEQPTAGGDAAVLDPRTLRHGAAGDAVLLKIVQGIAL